MEKQGGRRREEYDQVMRGQRAAGAAKEGGAPKKAERDPYHLPPINISAIQRDNSGLSVGNLKNVNQKKRRYANAMNRVEDRRLEDIQRNMNLAQSVTERTMERQSERLQRLLGDLEERSKIRYSQLMVGIDSTPTRRSREILASLGGIGAKKQGEQDRMARIRARRKKDSPIRQQLSSSSCPVLAFSYTDPHRQPLGRWVRYPRELPIPEDPGESPRPLTRSSSSSASNGSTGE